MKKSVSVLLLIIAMITLATVSYAGPPPGKPPKSEKTVTKKSIDQSKIVKTTLHRYSRQKILNDVGKYDFKPGLIYVDQQPGDVIPATMVKRKSVKSLSFYGHAFSRTGVKKIYRLIRP